MPEIPRITGSDILAQEGASKPVRPSTFLQLIGVQLAIGVGGLVAIVTLVLLVYWVFTAPPVSVATIPPDAEKLKQIIDFHKQLREIHLEPVLKLFDNIVLKCLFPLLTSILGYIFGSQSAKQSND
jgi:hypothetical protein